jgi:hypothetical protein
LIIQWLTETKQSGANQLERMGWALFVSIDAMESSAGPLNPFVILAQNWKKRYYARRRLVPAINQTNQRLATLQTIVEKWKIALAEFWRCQDQITAFYELMHQQQAYIDGQYKEMIPLFEARRAAIEFVAESDNELGKITVDVLCPFLTDKFFLFCRLSWRAMMSSSPFQIIADFLLTNLNCVLFAILEENRKCGFGEKLEFIVNCAFQGHGLHSSKDSLRKPIDYFCFAHYELKSMCIPRNVEILGKSYFELPAIDTITLESGSRLM